MMFGMGVFGIWCLSYVFCEKWYGGSGTNRWCEALSGVLGTGRVVKAWVCAEGCVYVL